MRDLGLTDDTFSTDSGSSEEEGLSVKDGFRNEPSDKKNNKNNNNKKNNKKKKKKKKKKILSKSARQKQRWVLKVVGQIPSILKALTQTPIQTAHIKEKVKKTKTKKIRN